jgi:hypothetical protein
LFAFTRLSQAFETGAHRHSQLPRKTSTTGPVKKVNAVFKMKKRVVIPGQPVKSRQPPPEGGIYSAIIKKMTPAE